MSSADIAELDDDAQGTILTRRLSLVRIDRAIDGKQVNNYGLNISSVPALDVWKLGDNVNLSFVGGDEGGVRICLLRGC